MLTRRTIIQDEGTQQGAASTVNFAGAGVSVAVSAGIATATIAGGAGSFSMSETELDFGSVPVSSAEFTVTDAAVTASSKILVTPSGNVATSRVGDDWAWDAITFAAIGATGTFAVFANTGRTTVVGKRKVFYAVA